MQKGWGRAISTTNKSIKPPWTKLVCMIFKHILIDSSKIMVTLLAVRFVLYYKHRNGILKVISTTSFRVDSLTLSQSYHSSSQWTRIWPMNHVDELWYDWSKMKYNKIVWIFHDMYILHIYIFYVQIISACTQAKCVKPLTWGQTHPLENYNTPRGQ